MKSSIEWEGNVIGQFGDEMHGMTLTPGNQETLVEHKCLAGTQKMRLLEQKNIDFFFNFSYLVNLPF